MSMSWIPPSRSSPSTRSGVRSCSSSVNVPMLIPIAAHMTVRVPVVLLLLALVVPAAAHAQADPGCVGDTDADAVARKPGPRLRFGIGPLVQAGQIGTAPAAPVPEQPARTYEALARLEPPQG